MRTVLIGALFAAVLVGPPLAAQEVTPTEPQSSLPMRREIQPVRTRFSAEVRAFKAADEVERPAACQVLLVGSSNVRYWTTAARDLAPSTVINRGIGNSTIRDVNALFNDIVAPYRPRLIILSAGDNDLNARRTPDEVLSDFETFLRLKSEALGSTPVYVLSVTPSSARSMDGSSHAEVNRRLFALAERRDDLVFLDVADGLARSGRTSGGARLSTQGFAVLASAVKPQLEASSPTRATGC